VPTSTPERPERMLAAGRAKLPFTGGGEALYRRYQLRHFVDGVLSNIGLPFPRFSVNRGSCSEPDDVLWHDREERRFEGWGVLEFTVSEARMDLATGDGRMLGFDLAHTPLDLNYAHSEVLCLNKTSGAEIDNPNRRVQKQYRVKLSQLARTVIPAES
jgi:hypothetical protein